MPTSADSHRQRPQTPKPARRPAKTRTRSATDAERRWTAVLLIAGVALLASLAGLANDFVQDDAHLIRDNVLVHDLGHLWELMRSPFWPPPFSPDLYRPLTSVLLAVEYVLGAGDPLVFRLASYVLYAASTLVVFVLAARLLPRRVALAAALLFAAHPLHVEAVALAVGQSELVVAIIAVVMTVRYLDRRRAVSLGVRDWAVLGALYVAACLFKETGLVIPALLLAAEAFLVDGPIATRVRSLAGGYVALAALGAVVLLARRAVLGGEIGGTFTAEALVGLSLGGRALTMLRVVPEWARLLVWPLHLRADYSPREIVASTSFGVREAFGLLLVAGALAAIWLARRRAPAVSFGLAWCAIALAPVSNVLIPTGILLAERTLFLPSVGFVLAVGGMVDLLASSRLVARDPARARRAATLACGLVVVLGVLRSAERQRVWRNEAFFAVRTVQNAPRSFRAQRAYGDVLFEIDQPKLALAAYDSAIAFAPARERWRVRNDLARTLRARGERAPEAEQLRASLAENPSQQDTRGYLVAAYLALGRYTDAAREADSAVAHGAPADVFHRLRGVADSAARVGAPPGAIKIGIVTGATTPVRP